MANVNWFAVLAAALGIYSVATNIDHIGSGLWLAGLVIGLVAVVAWRRDPKVGLWFVAASAALGIAGLFIHGPRTPQSLALTSGACTGMLAAFACVAARRLLKR